MLWARVSCVSIQVVGFRGALVPEIIEIKFVLENVPEYGEMICLETFKLDLSNSTSRS